MGCEVSDIMACFERSRSERSQMEKVWDRISRLMLPSRVFNGIPGQLRQERQWRDPQEETVDIYDATAPNAAEGLASAVYGMTMNPAVKWFGLRVEGEDPEGDTELRRWTERQTNSVLRLFSSPRRGFPTNSYEAVMDLVHFGHAVLCVKEQPKDLYFNTRPISEVYLEGDEDDRVSRIYRVFGMRASEMVREFGLENLPPTVVKVLEGREKDRLFGILHCVSPRESTAVYGRPAGPMEKPVMSVYIEMESRKVLREGGFDRNPFIVARWSKVPGEVYGRSPAMKALPFIGLVNAMSMTMAICGEKVMAPPWLVVADGLEGPFNSEPNSVTYVKSLSPELAPRALHPGTELGGSLALIQHVQQKIAEAFYIHLLSLPDNDRMTAFEISQRMQQRLQVMAPILARMESEFLTPLITHTFWAMMDKGMLEPPPEDLGDRRVVIDYVSPLAMSQRSSEVMSFNQAMSVLMPVAQADPRVLRSLKTEAIGPWLFSVLNVPPVLVRSQEEIAAIEASEMQQQQAQQGVEQAQGLAGAMKDGAAALNMLGAA